MLNWIKSWFTPKPKVGDFILTKEYKVKEKKKGGLVLRIEQHTGTAYRCSKGSFRISSKGKITWFQNGSVDISLSNIERILQVHVAQSILEKNIQKIKQ